MTTSATKSAAELRREFLDEAQRLEQEARVLKARAIKYRITARALTRPKMGPVPRRSDA